MYLYSVRLILAIALISPLWAQRLDHRLSQTNDEVRWPVLPTTLTYEEYKLLDSELGWMSMGYAFVVPGYAHFKAQEPQWGYGLLGTRLLGYGLLTYSYYRAKDAASIQGIETWNAWRDGANDSYAYLFSGMAVTFSSYLVDWIHGVETLQEKQRKIRYRYGIEIGRKLGDRALFIGIETNFSTHQ